MDAVAGDRRFVVGQVAFGARFYPFARGASSRGGPKEKMSIGRRCGSGVYVVRTCAFGAAADRGTALANGRALQ